VSINKPTFIFISTGDWESQIWTNKQNTALEFSRNGYKVFFIDSLGLRKIALNGFDLKKIIKKLIYSIYPPIRVKKNIWNYRPIVLPFNFLLAKKFNKFIFTLFVKSWMKILGFNNPYLITYNPCTPELINLSIFEKVIYHCVDDISSQPLMNKANIENLEILLSKKSNLIFCTSNNLYKKLISYNKNTYLHTNSIDVDFFDRYKSINYSSIKLDQIKKPILGFVGAIANYKINFELIEEIAFTKPEWSIVFIGKIGLGDPYTNVDKLKKYPNIYFLGNKKYKEIPYYISKFDVALLPSRINSYTKSMFPLKFFEYLYCNCPVVTTKLDSIKEFYEFCYVEDNAKGFIKVIENILDGSLKTDFARIKDKIKKNSYKERTKQMIKLIVN